MARAELVTHFWKEWGLHALVLLSFTLQVVLLILAEFRRRMNSGVLRAIVWSCYLLADTTAIYVLGHLSVTSRSREHQLIAFWAPFLLLHLGGQDNITAYAIEDTRLWLRHLQALAVQGVAAAYVLSESSVLGSRLSLRRAAILMFVVGFLKYGERAWALWNAGGTSSSNSYRTIHNRKDLFTQLKELDLRKDGDPDVRVSSFLKTAHLLLDVPKDFLKGPLPELKLGCGVSSLHMGDLYKVVETQLSLMHDIFYTKTELIHSLCGLLIRVASTVATAVALWLFHTVLGDEKDIHYNKVDVLVTYVLLVGALVLETMWLVRAMLSSWTWVALEEERDVFARNRVQELLAPVHASLRRLIHSEDWGRRDWPRRMDQHDLLELCSRSKVNRGSSFAKYLELEDRWNTLAFSWSIPVPELIGQLVAEQVDRTRKDESIVASEASEDHIFNSRGRAALRRRGLYHDHDGSTSKGLRFSIDGDGIELDKSILVWHIATKIYLCWFYRQQPGPAGDRAKAAAAGDQQGRLYEAVQALSNYVLFLLAARTYMLPPPNSRNEYVELCYCLTNPELQYDSAENLADKLCRYGKQLNAGNNGSHFPEFPSIIPGHENRKVGNLHRNKTLKKGSMLGAMLIGHATTLEGRLPPTEILELLAQVWAEILCYAGHRCAGYYHAKQLSNGGELITIAAILGHYISRAVMDDGKAQREDGQIMWSNSTVNLATGEMVSRGSEGITIRVQRN
ncbi:hypothetical protein BAE44_0005385 [Dichanthelium oligosanthes]|uniref:DUF4220 domain-containing protein n=1 Tax=Dichanthelium oligosanthes TaxID=888268 RepID=A0A1E5W891_9POAL|nr:hypothetical protein BAE44_0005385 [Dichanthelium oligosanthes]